MSFVYPSGLWLLAVLLVPIILSLRKKRSETRQVSSVFLWKLTQQRKPKAPLKRLKRFIFFALQLLILLLAVLLIAQPVFCMPGANVNAIIILDGSGSMRIADDMGNTRFSRAIAVAKEDIAALPWGARFSVIVAGDEPVLALCQAERQERNQLDSLTCGWGSGTLENAFALVQETRKTQALSHVLIYTDKQAEEMDNLSDLNIKLTNVKAETDWNITLGELEERTSIYGTVLETMVTASGREANLSFAVTVDGQHADKADMTLSVNGEPQETLAASCKENETIAVQLLLNHVYDYSQISLTAEAADGLVADNTVWLVKETPEKAKALLVGDGTYFWEQAFLALERVEISLETDNDSVEAKGYDLYLYNNCIPEPLPEDGAVWLCNPPRSPRAMGVVFGDWLMGTTLTKETTESELGTQLGSGLLLSNAAAARFREITDQGDMENILLCGKMPVLLAGKGDNGFLQVVMSCDLQETNLPLLPDFVVLTANLLEASAPRLLAENKMLSGSVATLKAGPKCHHLLLETPDIRVKTIEVEQPVVSFDAPGVYTLYEESTDGPKTQSVIVRMPEAQTLVNGEESITLATLNEPLEGRKPVQAEERLYHAAHMIALLLVMLLLIEWGMCYREGY